MKQSILGAALGNCVHVGGLSHFLAEAEAEGYAAIMLGPAVPPSLLIEMIEQHRPDVVAVSFRLTPEVAAELFEELKSALTRLSHRPRQFVFGGTPSVAVVASASGIFARVFSGGEDPESIREWLRGGRQSEQTEHFADTLLARIEQRRPWPLLRHHFGRPSLAETRDGMRALASARVLDVISIAPDQNAQEFFFTPEQMQAHLDGAGGVPVRTAQDLSDLYTASRCGNHPLLRCYSGTRDLLRWAEMSVATIHTAWGAIPLTWYSVIDGRSTRSLEEAIAENQATMRWYAGHGVPVEVNESHQWSLRDAHDSLAVAMAFLAA